MFESILLFQITTRFLFNEINKEDNIITVAQIWYGFYFRIYSEAL